MTDRPGLKVASTLPMGISILLPSRHWPMFRQMKDESRNQAVRELGLTIANLLLFAAATFGSYFAMEHGRRVSAVLIYLLGVTLVGASSGLRVGLLAGIAASAIYNFFLSEPLFAFGASSADDLIPLIAFNVTAILSGTLAGRLNDRAKAAEQAQAQLDRLLQISSRLQKAVLLEDVVSAIGEVFAAPDEVELFIAENGRVRPVGHIGHGSGIASQVIAQATQRFETEEHVAFRVGTADVILGVIVFGRGAVPRGKAPRIDIEAFVNLISIAVERCLLLHQLSETEAMRRSEELKTALLSSLSHDLRTPLAAISASASSLASFGTELSPEVREEMLQTIQEQCSRLNRYTTNLLNLGQLQAGIGAEQMEKVDAIELLGAAIGSARTNNIPHIC
ncbi:DUF4118 domain-containing protein [Rhizorhapis sp. SPR117]|uniref:DUF4118 domain-containing protein n=1 Tax=Rhizorhapis sp. SPR117 TaxID=2912611 RepID=UPI001F1969D4|nr:DUF4118 domain-containing protein [Rhizorhapis sp. SPR117]